ncbi:hypothetical protein F0562_026051 [Nyssa sinensis]|uniref:Uncharacterized protein n=1 Tax=Nyssa sinensis TaxID=561372 RepID=A0A5J5B9R1_9ASTE|nr:hypothetical protein F0562_026051 [Nyssa sinensis]
MDADGNKTHLEVEKLLPLIDISSEDDFLIASPFRDILQDLRLSVALGNINEHEGFKLFETANSSDVQNASEQLGQMEQKLIPSKSMELGRASNLRKSLAWDSAFFTSAGVLDPEELSIMNRGFEKDEAHELPSIREDVIWRSADTEYILDSDDFSLEGIDANLFEDVRASIQRSSKMYNVASSGCKSGFGAGMQNIHSSKKLDVSSRNRVKSMPAFRRQSINMQGSEGIKKEASIRAQMVQHTARSGESNSSSLKPPNKLRQTNPISGRQTKRASSGTNYVKTENKIAKAGSGQGSMVSKKSGLGDSYGLTNTSKPSPKSSSSVSLTARNDSTCSSYDTSSSASSSKSSSNSLRRKTESRNTKAVASVSTSNTPLRYSTRSKIGLGNPILSIHLLSMSNHSSCTSPASSIDGWSSESSTSTSTVNQRSISSEASLDTTSFKGAHFGSDQASDLQSHPCDQSSFCQESPSRGTDPVAAEPTRNFKPSSLRMPSPKIGFFDEDKSMVPAVRGCSRVHFEVQSALPYFNRATNRKRAGKLQTFPDIGDLKLGSQQNGVLHPALGIKPSCAVQFQKLDNASPKVSGTMQTLKNCLDTAPKAHIDISPEVGREKCLKTRKVGAEGHDTRKFSLHSSLREEGKGTEGILKNKMGIERKGHPRLRANKISANKDESVLSQEINPYKKEHEETSQHHLENGLHLLHKNKKENLSNCEDRVNGLSRYFEVIDLSRDMVIEPKGKGGYSHSQFGDNYLENYSAPVVSSCSTEHLICGQQKDSLNILSKPSPLYLPTTVEFIPSTRTVLADRTSVCNRSGSFGELIESTIVKASTFPHPDSTEKENS